MLKKELSINIYTPHLIILKLRGCFARMNCRCVKMCLFKIFILVQLVAGVLETAVGMIIWKTEKKTLFLPYLHSALEFSTTLTIFQALKLGNRTKNLKYLVHAFIHIVLIRLVPKIKNIFLTLLSL